MVYDKCFIVFYSFLRKSQTQIYKTNVREVQNCGIFQFKPFQRAMSTQMFLGLLSIVPQLTSMAKAVSTVHSCFS